MSDMQPNQNPYGQPPPGYTPPQQQPGYSPYAQQQPGQMPNVQQPYGQPPYGQMQPYMPAPGAPGSMTGPLKVIGILYIVFGSLALLGGLALPVVMTLVPDSMGPDRAMGLGIVYGFSLLVLLIGAVEVTSGYGLMTAKPWGRTLGIVLACFSLLSIPLGTALGGYTLYTLLKSRAKEEYDMLSNTARRT